jgi:hypothetical protein
MKNLTLQSVCTVDIDLGPASADDDPIRHFCLESTEGLLYAVTRSGLVLCLAQGGKKVCKYILKPFVAICSGQAAMSQHNRSCSSVPPALWNHQGHLLLALPQGSLQLLQPCLWIAKPMTPKFVLHTK